MDEGVDNPNATSSFTSQTKTLSNIRERQKETAKERRNDIQNSETKKDILERNKDGEKGRKKLHSENHTYIYIYMYVHKAREPFMKLFAAPPWRLFFSLPPHQLSASSHLLSAGEAKEASKNSCIKVSKSATVHPGAAVAVDGCNSDNAGGALLVFGDLRLRGGSLALRNCSASGSGYRSWGGAVCLTGARGKSSKKATSQGSSFRGTWGGKATVQGNCSTPEFIPAVN